MAITAKLVKELREKTGAGMMDCKKALVATDGDLDGAVTWLREQGISKAAKKSTRVAAEGLCDVVVEGNTAILFEINSETDFVAKNDKFLALLDKVGKIFMTAKASNAEEALAVVSEGKTVKEILAEATFTIGEKLEARRVVLVEKTDAQVFGFYKHMGGRIVALTVLEGTDVEVAKDVAMHIAAINPRFVDDSSIPAEVLAAEKEVQIQTALNEGKPEKIVERMVIGRMNKFKKDICLVDQPFVKNSDETVGKFVASKNMKVINFVRFEVGEGVEKRQDDFAAEVAAQANQQ